MADLNSVLEALFIFSGEMEYDTFIEAFPNRTSYFPVFKAAPVIFYNYLNTTEAFKFREMLIEKVLGGQ